MNSIAPSAIECACGIIRLANRYAEKAREMAAEEADETRKAELLQIAEICDVVPENPPKSFRSHAVHHGLHSWAAFCPKNPLAWNPGRFDQYMYPYYKADKDAGVISKMKHRN